MPHLTLSKHTLVKLLERASPDPCEPYGCDPWELPLASRASRAPAIGGRARDACRRLLALVHRLGSVGLYGLEEVLRVARRDHDQSKHRAVARVPRGMGHPSRDEYEAAGGDSNLAVA